MMEQERIQWPAGSALTARLRRLITAYQRYTRREPLRHDFLLHEGIAPVAWQIGEFRHCTTEPDPLFLEWQRRQVMQCFIVYSYFLKMKSKILMCFFFFKYANGNQLFWVKL